MNGRNLAYLIYTSGSSGQPKGVAIEHRNVCNYIAAQQLRLQTGPGATSMQAFSFSFDASVWEWILVLMGAKMVVLQAAQRSGAELKEFIEANGIEIILITPSLLRMVPPGGMAKLHTICSGAEAVPEDVVNTWAEGRRFFNCYGPTEATIITTMSDPLVAGATPSLGTPILNARVFVFDDSMNPAPVGARGELYIGGGGLARAYWNQPALTAERFVPDPLSGETGARLYRTGDIVRWRPDGNLDFLGRADQQVKIRGYRVELSEIESVLIGCPGVREAAVIAREDEPGNRSLVAYIVRDRQSSAEPLTAAELKARVREKLPEYMVPSAIVEMEAIPVTAHGKLDRRALPRPERVCEDEYVEPRTETEKKLAQLWAEVLKAGNVGLHDNFFDLGGHSLLAMQLISRVREAFRVEISVGTLLLEAPTLSAMAAAVERLLAASPAQPVMPERIEARPRKPVDVAGTMARIDELSEEEVSKLLEQARASSQ